MTWLNGVVLYLLIWWTVLFAMLPIGAKPVSTPDEHSGWRGAPAQSRILLKAIATTIVAGLIWLACYGLIASGWLSFRHGWLAMPE